VRREAAAARRADAGRCEAVRARELCQPPPAADHVGHVGQVRVHHDTGRLMGTAAPYHRWRTSCSRSRGTLWLRIAALLELVCGAAADDWATADSMPWRGSFSGVLSNGRERRRYLLPHRSQQRLLVRVREEITDHFVVRTHRNFPTFPYVLRSHDLPPHPYQHQVQSPSIPEPTLPWSSRWAINVHGFVGLRLRLRLRGRLSGCPHRSFLGVHKLCSQFPRLPRHAAEFAVAGFLVWASRNSCREIQRAVIIVRQGD
jgi:hypothetical protein